MKKLAFAIVLMSFNALALDLDQVFKPLRENGPRCFGREYNPATMPKQQTVQKIRAKLEARRDQYYSTPVFYNILTIEVFQKSNLDLKLTQALSCESRHTGITCVLDCDGGSVAISSLGKDRRIDSLNDVLKLSNNGVFVQGGCGDSRQNVLLDRTEGGDDVFKLVELPASECDSITYDYVDEEEEDLL